MAQDYNRRRQDDGWHIKKTMDAGHILTTLVLVLTAVFYFTDLDARILLLEDRSARRDIQLQEMRSDIKDIKNLLWEYTREKDD